MEKCVKQENLRSLVERNLCCFPLVEYVNKSNWRKMGMGCAEVTGLNIPGCNVADSVPNYFRQSQPFK